MVNKQKKSSIVKYIIIFGIVILTIFIFWQLIFSRSSRSRLPSSDTNQELATPDAQNAQPLNLSYTGEGDIGIKEVGVYQVKKDSSNKSVLLANLTKTLVAHYSLQPIFDEEGVVIYASEDHTLTINLSEDNLNFSRNNPQGDESTINQDQAINAAKDFLKIILPEQTPLPIVRNIEYFKGDLHLEPSSKLSASTLLIPFSYSLEEIPIYYDDSPTPFFLIMVNSNLQIQKAEAKTLLITSEKISTAELMPLVEALENIRVEQTGQLVDFLEIDQALIKEPTLERIKQGTLKTAQLEYRAEEKQGLIYPFYRFKGEFVDIDDVAFYGEIITPAVKIGR